MNTGTNPTIELAKKLLAVEQQRVIKERVENLQQTDPALTFASAWDKLRASDPELFGANLVHVVEMGESTAAAAGFSALLPGNGAGKPRDDPEQVRRRKIQALVEEVLKVHPGITFKTAYLTVQHQNSELFPEMENSDVKEKNMARQEKIKGAVEELRTWMPHLNFAAAWHFLQKEKPELFEFAEA